MLRSTITAAVLFAALAVPGSGAAAQGAPLPDMQRGEWQLVRTITPDSGSAETVESTDCQDPDEEWRLQRERFDDACNFTSVVKNGNRYTFSATCKGEGVTATSWSVLEADGGAAYTLTVDSRANGKRTQERLVARRMGDCAGGQ